MQRQSDDFFQHVPDTYHKNIAFRKEIRKRCIVDRGFREAMRLACKNETLFFFSAFCWLYEPRKRFFDDGSQKPSVIPFIPWPHQCPAILDIREDLGEKDIGIEKSRGEGFSWIGVLLALQDWLFEDMAAIGMVSRNELMGDNPEDPDSLFWKIDWELKQLPPWMAGLAGIDWKRDRNKHSLLNNRNYATIVSQSATGEVGSGGRKRWYLMDELSKFPVGADTNAMVSTNQTTDSRLIGGTPYGAKGEYHHIMQIEDSGMKKLRFHWSDNTSKNRGLYTFDKGVITCVDSVNNPLLSCYNPATNEVIDRWRRLEKKGFNLSKGPRSDWYDLQCDRPSSTPSSIAQELDIDYGGSAHVFFGDEFQKRARATIKNPRQVGNVTFHPENHKVEFETYEHGECSLWCPLDHDGNPPDRDYVIGVDISTGSGGAYTSNSVLEIIDRINGEQVMELATNTTKPSELAELSVAVAKWFNGAYLAWEQNGPGGEYGRRVIELGYGNIYRRVVLWKKSKRGRSKKEPGWRSSKPNKVILMGDIRKGVMSDDFIVRSKALCDESVQYVHDGDKITHLKTIGATNPSAVGENHGDRVIAFGVAIVAAKDRPAPKAEEKRKHDPDNPPMGTLAWREKERRKELVSSLEDGMESGLVGW